MTFGHRRPDRGRLLPVEPYQASQVDCPAGRRRLARRARRTLTPAWDEPGNSISDDSSDAGQRRGGEPGVIGTTPAGNRWPGTLRRSGPRFGRRARVASLAGGEVRLQKRQGVGHVGTAEADPSVV